MYKQLLQLKMIPFLFANKVSNCNKYTCDYMPTQTECESQIKSKRSYFLNNSCISTNDCSKIPIYNKALFFFSGLIKWCNSYKFQQKTTIILQISSLIFQFGKIFSGSV
ncbi:unnamed protein product (macronuclear) [Paramecium tetraurelia]|uniref:Uncharacterized protein n=1 Tax=Paramecium tetraurelia TaxID=5888 RepID=A0CQ25_PARTE|nr:uncharacterized protein GSPATT00009240001 [Paramecium tetraurelia]CAK72892.1 unnamed protein product [Paramecium tetraurelia]|eukprot:XP_001440289.1 hypothetical protein (macronuclear) [Paramecium tetraurelia strain d4-2]